MNYHVLCIDDDANFLTKMKFDLGKQCRLSTATNLGDGTRVVQNNSVDLVFLDIGLGQENGIEGLRQIKALDPSLDVVMVSGHRDPRLIVQAVRAGASDYICKPFEKDELVAVMEKLEHVKMLRDHHDALLAGLNPSDAMSRIVGVSRAVRDLLDKAARLKGHDANVLIEGESGTGKELVARYLHSIEDAKHRPFIAVNCAAIPENLIESELFGHEKGSFTGAIARKIGKFELANGGDIFLDEISSLRLDLQAKILRVLQEKEICRIGGQSTIKVGFRVISATNENLDAMVAHGTFRMDLFHRLRVVQLGMPPLRGRAEDIPLLVRHFLGKYSKPGHHKEMSPEALEYFKTYRWPGNVRELENIVHNLIIMSPNGVIGEADLPGWIKKSAGTSDATAVSAAANAKTLKECLKTAEKAYIEKALRAVNGNKSKAAADLDVSRTTLHTKLKELGIE